MLARQSWPAFLAELRRIENLEETMQAAHGAIDHASRFDGFNRIYAEDSGNRKAAFLDTLYSRLAAHDRCFYDPPIASFPLTFPICATGI